MTCRHAALGALGALVFGAMVAAWPLLDSKWEAYKYARWQERQIAWFQGDGFATLAPWVHYYWARRLLQHRTDIPWIPEPSKEAVTTAIRHLEAIPPESDVYAQAAELLPLLRLKRDRPQDFPAVEEASYRSCIARSKAQEEEVREQVARERPCRHLLTSDGKCIYADLSHDTADTDPRVTCAPLAGSERLAQLRALVLDRN